MHPVLGYLDPGSGSVILQALLGGLAGLVVGLKMFGRRLLNFLRIGRSGSKQAAASAPDRDPS
jgi:hypothetical protein